MPCRHAAGADGDRGIDDDHFRKTALSIGGREALETAIAREGAIDVERGDSPPTGGKQHEWIPDDDAHHDAEGECPVHEPGENAPGRSGSRAPQERGDGSPEECPVDHGNGSEIGTEDENGRSEGGADGRPGSDPSPRYQLLLSLSLDCDPDPDVRTAVGTALSELASALGWGPEGLVATLGYSRAYARRSDVDLPGAVVAAAGFDTPSDPAVVPDGGTDDPDALLHLASDDVRHLLAAELALWGEPSPVDPSLSATFEGIFERPREPPRRRAAVAGQDWSPPTGAAGIDAGGRYDGAVLETVRPLDVADSDPDRNPNRHSGSDREDGDGGGCPVDHSEAHSQDVSSRATGGASPPTGGRLLGLDPDDPDPIAVEFHGSERSDGTGHRHGEGSAADRGRTYLVPPVGTRALPGVDPTGS